MEAQKRGIPALIPENEELTEVQMSSFQDRQNGVESEVPLSKSQRRRSDVKVYKEFCDFYARFNMANALANAICELCKAGFSPAEKIVNSNGELYHEQCFVCAQCFQQFSEGLYYEFDDRKYCEHDFHMLFAPCCNQCGEFIIGRVIKAMNNSWHPECFCCDLCHAVLADVGFAKNAGRHLCRPCHIRERACGLGKYICQKCHTIIDEQPLIFQNDPYHPDHFNCSNCGKELTADARELKNELYCLPCHDKMGVPICGACRRPIEGRVVNAVGKQWHVEGGDITNQNGTGGKSSYRDKFKDKNFTVHHTLGGKYDLGTTKGQESKTCCLLFILGDLGKGDFFAPITGHTILTYEKGGRSSTHNE
ncbi:LIM and senescent cell antigen-like-containing domain protein 1 [Bagarius yarrelli]|uniref:LIM and senescent cell antigen-like-containing domain protein 1 n=1 Tax=Bagarius yarrelli TaxID=175774 RepID=A0A556UZI2_BAGYA|nr:LIM and senescent cell antigen-like-containing domain protein 1 [Bagarius yarrelli]